MRKVEKVVIKTEGGGGGGSREGKYFFPLKLKDIHISFH
jgi:hypothetical protein